MPTRPSSDATSSLSSEQINRLWEKALAADDATKARQLFPYMGQGSHPFQEILLFDGPRPWQVMDAAFEVGLLRRDDWLLIAFEHSENKSKPHDRGELFDWYSHDWGELFDWYSRRAGPAAWRQAVVKSLEHVGRKVAHRNGKDFMEAALDRDPSLVQEIHEGGRLAWLVMFALHRPEKEWLDQSPFTLDAILNEALLLGGLTHAINTQNDGTSLLEAWLNHVPRRRQAWELIQAQDLKREALLEDWFQQWVPDGVWKDSPLAYWLEQPVADKPGADDPTRDPTFHPALGPWTQLPFAERHAIAQKHLEVWLLAAGGAQAAGVRLDESLRRAINGMCRKQVDRELLAFWGHHDTPVDPLAICIKHGPVNVIEQPGSPAQTARIQALVDQGRRGEALLTIITVPQAVNIMITDPAWRSWKNQRGMSLLDVALDMTKSHSVGSYLTQLSREQVMKLDKVFPGLLTSPNEQGDILLNRLDITPAVRRGLIRKKLKSVARPGLRGPSPKMKM